MSTLLASLGLVAFALSASAQFNLNVMERVDANDTGVVATLPSRGASISADGRFAVFSTFSDNLIPGDTNLIEDVYMRDLRTGKVMRVSVPPAGGQISMAATNPQISGDGRLVAFECADPTLVPGDANGVVDVFICDTTDGSMIRESVTSGGGEVSGISCEPGLSADGLWLAFASDAASLWTVGPHHVTGGRHIYLRDRANNRTWRASLGQPGMQHDVQAGHPVVSMHGRFVAFEARDLTTEIGMPAGSSQLYLFDRTTDSVTLVSRDDFGVPANADCTEAAISDNGRFVAYASLADNLVAGDTNGAMDVFIFDRIKQITRRLSVDSLGNQANAMSYRPSLSETGRFVSFTSLATNLSGLTFGGGRAVFVRDNDLGVVQLASINSDAIAANNVSMTSNGNTLSADGRFVVFDSLASNLVPGTFQFGMSTYRLDRRSFGPRLEWSPPTGDQRVNFMATGVTPLSPLVIAIGSQGQGPTPSAFGLIDVSLPVRFFVAYSDGQGRASFDTFLPPITSGKVLCAQGLDVFGESHTNPLAALVQ